MAHKSDPQPNDTARRWALRFTAGATATGCLWGLSASILLLTDDPSYHVFIAFVLGGMIAGSVTIDAAFLPLCLALGRRGDAGHFGFFSARPEPTSGTRASCPRLLSWRFCYWACAPIVG